MKITEKIWNEVSKELVKDINSNGDYYYQNICKKIFKEEVFVLYSSSVYTPVDFEVSEEGIHQISEFIMKILPNKFELTPGFPIIISKRPTSNLRKKVTDNLSGVFEQKNVLISSCYRPLEIQPTVLFGEGYVVFLKVGEEVYIDEIVYTSSATKDVLQLVTMFREFFYTMVNRKSNNSFTIETLVTRYQNLASVTHKVTLEDNIDLSLDFPSDLPHAQIQEFIESDKSGIAIFHGQPGCGKSSYIKYLIKTNPSERFTVVSTDLILRSPEKVRDYMINNGKSRIYILEDCENLLRSRDSGNESGTVLSDILNFADGILGSLTKTKYILTFNSSLAKIDEALQRRGRLKIKYEFGPLRGDDLKRASDKLGINLTSEDLRNGLTLADLHNYASPKYTKEKKRIGF